MPTHAAAPDLDHRNAAVPELRIVDLLRPLPEHASPHLRRVYTLIREHADDVAAELASPTYEEVQARAMLCELLDAAIGWARIAEETIHTFAAAHPARVLYRVTERIRLRLDVPTHGGASTLTDAAVSEVLARATPTERARAAAAILIGRRRA